MPAAGSPLQRWWPPFLVVLFVGVAYANVLHASFQFDDWDVIVRESHRGRGIGGALVQRALEHPDLRTVSTFLLLTRDKHSFYERLGFTREREMAMVLRR